MFKDNPAVNHPDWSLIKFELSEIVSKSDVISIMLIGSYSRGDYWRNKKYISDVEFYIVVNNINQYLKNIKTVYCDISVIKFTKLKCLRKNLINYESKEKGIIIYGRDIRVYMPDISIENIEIDIVDEIVLFRLYEIAKFIVNKKDYKFAFIKNLNYLLTWSLTRDGVLLEGFSKRVKFIKNDFSEYKITHDLFYDSFKLLSSNIDARRGKKKLPVFTTKIENIYNELIKNYTSLLFKNRSFNSTLRQIYYMSKTKNLSLINRLLLIFKILTFSDYRKQLTLILHDAIKKRDKLKMKKYISKINDYYPFLND